MALPYNLGRTTVTSPTIAALAVSQKRWACRFTTVEAGVPTTAFFYSNGCVAATNVKLAIYEYQSGSPTNPGALVCVSAPIALPMTTAQWNSVSWGADKVALAASTNYWLVCLQEDAADNMKTNYFGSGTMARRNSVGYSSPANPFGTPDATGVGELCMYAVIDVGPPANTVAPVASGTPSVGSTLSVTNGTWTNSPSSYTYQWKRDGASIGGATAATYDVVSGDRGKAITCTVTATNGGGSASADSNALSVPNLGGGVPGSGSQSVISGFYW